MLARDEKALRCEAGHAFDVARQGYVSLLASETPHSGDSAEMVAARERFQSAGHYAPLAEAVAVAAGGEATEGGRLLELGAGTGYYLAGALEAVPGAVAGVAIDVSRPAAQRAARAHPRIGSVRCDAWSALPLRDDSIAAAISAFAPRNAPELGRVIVPGGALVAMTPAADHLAELAEPLGLIGIEVEKAERLEEQLAPDFESVERRALRFALELAHADVSALAAMGPSARHIWPEQLTERIAALSEPVSVGVSVEVARYRRRQPERG